MVYDFIENNFVAVAITVFLMLFIMTNNNFEKKVNRLFLIAISCVLILIIEEAWEAQLALKPTFEPLRIWLSALGYSLRPIIPLILVMLARNYSPKETLVLSIPAIFNLLAAYSAIFCKISFGYTADNQFVRGLLGYTPFIVAGLYIVFLLIFTIKQCKIGGGMEAMIVSAIVLLAFVSTILESIFHFQFIQNPSIATSITFYYLFLHSNRNNRDVLTGALTRRRFYLDADKYKSILTAVISLDLNDLKMLNDKYGHMEGDKALVAITNVIDKHTNSKSALYRIGGDEFMILCHKTEEKKIQNMIAAIREDLEKTKYRCAIGYAMVKNKMKFEQVCHIADNMMYDNKRQMKNKIKQEGQ